MFLGGGNKLLEKTTGNSNYDPQTKYITMNVNKNRGAGFLTSIQVQGIEFIHNGYNTPSACCGFILDE